MTLLDFLFFLRGTRTGKALVYFLLYSLLNPALVLGLPEGGQVESGTADIQSPNPTTLNITTSDQVIINWSSFNIAANESVNFIQPAVTSVALNRVLGGGATNIAGALSANGGVIIVNPAGINNCSRCTKSSTKHVT